MAAGNHNSNPYDRNFYNEDYTVETGRSAHEIVDQVWPLLQPGSVVDVGCGTGLFLESFSRMGVVDIYGIDGDWMEPEALRIPQEKFLRHDLTQAIKLDRCFDLAICLEVAEHLPAHASATIVESLVSLSPVVLFSAAIPMQGGVSHLNEQWPEYWAGLFADRGYHAVDCVRRHIWTNEKVMWWYAQNAILYVREDQFQRHPRLQEELKKAEGLQLSLVHPRAFLLYRQPKPAPAPEAVSFRDVLATGKRWIRQQLRKPDRQPMPGE